MFFFFYFENIKRSDNFDLKYIPLPNKLGLF